MSKHTRPGFGQILAYSFSRVFYPLWLLPMLVVALLLPLHIDGTLTLAKAISEPIAPVMLGLAMAISAFRWHTHRSAFLLWITVFLFVFFCRELHFVGTSTMVYVGFLVLMFIAWHQYPRMGAELGSKIFLSLFSTALVSYIIAVGLDNHWWKFLPGHKYQWARVEEYVEITGHLMMIILVILTRPVANPLLEAPEENSDQSK